MRFSEELYSRSAPIQKEILSHPFVLGIGNGSLSMEKFKHFVCQDYLYLIEYSRVLALAVVKTPSLETMGPFASLLNETLNVEMDLHRGFCSRLGIQANELEATKPTFTTQAYTDFLLRTGFQGSFDEMACALLPCMWGYCEIGLVLSSNGKPEAQPLFCEWIDMYSSDEFRELSDWMRSVVDELGNSSSPGLRKRMYEAYRTSVGYEYAFWDMAWRLEPTLM